MEVNWPSWNNVVNKLSNSWAGNDPHSLQYDPFFFFFISGCFRCHPQPLVLKPSATLVCIVGSLVELPIYWPQSRCALGYEQKGISKIGETYWYPVPSPSIYYDKLWLTSAHRITRHLHNNTHRDRHHRWCWLLALNTNNWASIVFFFLSFTFKLWGWKICMSPDPILANQIARIYSWGDIPWVWSDKRGA